MYNKDVKSKVYVETSVISYLTARPSRDILIAAMRANVELVCRLNGYEPPVICSPMELMEV